MTNIKHLKQKGFTLIELAIVLIMFGFVTSALLLALSTYTEKTRIDKTTKAVNNSRIAVSTFLDENNGIYPCPSDMTLPTTDVNYGYSMTAADFVANVNLFNGRDADNADGDNSQTTGQEQYVVGGVPFNTLKNTNSNPMVNAIDASGVDVDFTIENVKDGWNRQITYAVSRHLCDPTDPNFGEGFGALDVIIENTDAANQAISLLPEGQYAHFVILSHGENGRGARTLLGEEFDPCVNVVVIPPPPGTLPTDSFINGRPPNDRQNCNYGFNKGVFISGLKSEGDDDTYFDDYIKFYFADNYRTWESTPPMIVPDIANPPNTIEIARMNRANENNIGINTDTPDEAVQVSGDVLASEIRAEGFCDTSSGGNCMPAETLAGNEPDMRCSSGAVKSIEKNKVICENPFDGYNFTCGLDGSGNQQYLKAVRSDGTFDCVTP